MPSTDQRRYKNVKKGDSALDAGVLSTKDTSRTGLGLYFNEGINTGRPEALTLGDVGSAVGRKLGAQPDVSAAVVAGTSSAENNPFNHLKHLKATCSYNIDYFINPGILTHAGSALRKAMFTDIREFVELLNERVKIAKLKLQKEAESAIAQVIKKQANTSKSIETQNTTSSEIVYDLLNIPWELKVPTDADQVQKRVASLGEFTDINQIDNPENTKHITPSYSLSISCGKNQFTCPKGVTHAGFIHLGKLLKPIFLPINPSASYGGVFGKVLTDLLTATKGNIAKANVTGKMASIRMSFPSRIEEPDGASIVIANLMGDYASIASPYLIYDSGKVYDAEEGKSTAVLIDDEWKSALVSGSLFDSTSDPNSYSTAKLKDKTVIKNGTENIEESELDERIGSKEKKLNSHFYRRVALESPPNKAGSTKPREYLPNEKKDFVYLADSPVRDVIADIPWERVISNRYKNAITIEELKTGRNFLTPSDIPTFHFWAPMVFSRAIDNDGSNIYSYLEPKMDRTLEGIKVICTPSAPIAKVRAGVTFTKFTDYLQAKAESKEGGFILPESPPPENTKIVGNFIPASLEPGLIIDERITGFGLGNFYVEKNQAYFGLTVSTLAERVLKYFSSAIPIFGEKPNMPRTYRIGGTELSIYNELVKAIASSVDKLTKEFVANVDNPIIISTLKRKSIVKSDNISDIRVDPATIAFSGTEIQTRESKTEIPVYVSDETVEETILSEKEIPPIVIVNIDSLSSAKIFLGKTINIKGMEDSKTLQVKEPEYEIVDSPIEEIPIISASEKSFISDIQPGESIIQKEKLPQELGATERETAQENPVNDLSETSSEDTPASEQQQGTIAPTQKPEPIKENAVEYSFAEGITKYALHMEDLIAPSSVTRFGIADVISCLIGSEYNDLTNQENSPGTTGPTVSNYKSRTGPLLQGIALMQKIIEGPEKSIPPISKSWVPVGKITFPEAGEEESQSKVSLIEKADQIGLMPALGILLKSSEHFFIEYFEDVQETEENISPLIFYDESGTITKGQKKIQKYVTIKEDNSVETVPLSPFSDIDSPQNINSSESVEVEIHTGSFSFEPWDGFLKRKDKYQERRKQFSIIDQNTKRDLVGTEKFDENVELYINKLCRILEAIDGSNQVVFDTKNFREDSGFSSIVSIFSKSPFSLLDPIDARNTLRRIVPYLEFTDISSAIVPIGSELYEKINKSAYGKIVAAAVYGANNLLKKVDLSKKEELLVFGQNLWENELDFYSQLVESKQKVPDELLDLPFNLGPATLSEEDELKVRRMMVATIAGYILGALVIREQHLIAGADPFYGAKKELDVLLAAIEKHYVFVTKGLLSTAPRYSVGSGEQLGTLISNIVNTEITRDGIGESGVISLSFKEARSLFSSWFEAINYKEPSTLSYRNRESEGASSATASGESYSEFALSKVSLIRVPVCIVEKVPTESDIPVYSFVDMHSGESLKEFAKNLQEGKYLILYKDVSKTWLGTSLLDSDQIKIDKIKYTSLNAAFTLNILDYIGFCIQSYRELSERCREASSLKENEKEAQETIAEKRARAAAERKKRIDNAAVYVKEGNNYREYYVKLNDFCNLVQIKDTGSSPKIKKLFPLFLRNINDVPKEKPADLTELVERGEIDLSDYGPDFTRYLGIYLRPGYGAPDLVKGIGYRCKIESLGSLISSGYKQRRFAFHSRYTEDAPTLWLSGMMKNALGEEEFSKVLKASEWTSRNASRETVKNQLYSTDVPKKIRSVYDNFVPKNLNARAIFDIEIGYMSTRPLIGGEIKARIPPVKIKVRFSGMEKTANYVYLSSLPGNFLFFGETGDIRHYKSLLSKTRKSKERPKAGENRSSLSPDRNVPIIEQLQNFIRSNLDPTKLPTGKKTTGDTKLHTDQDFFNKINQLSAFHIPVATTMEEIEDTRKLFADGVKNKQKKSEQERLQEYNTIVEKISSLVRADKLRDIAFNDSCHITIGGRVAENRNTGSSPYPVMQPGFFSEASLKNPSVEQYTTVKTAGQNYTNLYEPHPLSYLTSPSFIGLSRRRAISSGLHIISSLLEKANYFIPKPGAKNQFAGIYFWADQVQYDKSVLAMNERKFTNNERTNSYRIIIIPDFPETSKDIRELCLSELSGITQESVSEKQFFDFFGTGTLLSGKFTESPKRAKGPASYSFVPTDSMGNRPGHYRGKYNIIKTELQKWEKYAKEKGGEEYFSCLNGSPFLENPEATVEESLKNKQFVYKISNFPKDKDLRNLVNQRLPELFNPGRKRQFTSFKMVELEDSLYFTAAFLSRLALEKKYASKKESEKIKKLTTFIEQAIETGIKEGTISNQDLALFLEIDLFALLSGGFYSGKPGENNYFSSDVYSYNEYTKGKGSERSKFDDEFIKTYVAAQLYIGSHRDPDDPTIESEVADIGILGRRFLCPTTIFGKNTKLASFVEDGIKPQFISYVEESSTYNGKKLTYEIPRIFSYNSGPGTESVERLFTDPVSAIVAMRINLAYEWFKENLGNVEIPCAHSQSGKKKISEVTLYDITHIDTEYFVKNIGPVLYKNFDKERIPLSELTDNSLNLDPVIDRGDNKKQVLISSGRAHPLLKASQVGELGVALKEITLEKNGGAFAIESFMEKCNWDKDNDLTASTTFLSLLWSMFSMKVFCGIDDIGIKAKVEDIVTEIALIAGTEKGKTPALLSMSAEKTKLYEHIRMWNASTNKDRYVRKIVRKGTLWYYTSAKDEKLFTETEFRRAEPKQTANGGKITYIGEIDGLEVVELG